MPPRKSLISDNAYHGDIIWVRQYLGTYIARCAGKTASSTAGPEQAAHAVARKLLGTSPYTLKQLHGALMAWEIQRDNTIS